MVRSPCTLHHGAFSSDRTQRHLEGLLSQASSAYRHARSATRAISGTPASRYRRVLVFQGGGALGAYQAGVYQALHEAGYEPDWVIGTSIGAINASLIAGNEPSKRMERLDDFWSRVTTKGGLASWAEALRPWMPSMAQSLHTMGVVTGGLPAFFTPRWQVWMDPMLHGLPEHASCYDTAPLRDTLNELVDWQRLEGGTRLTVGAVNVRSGHMRYFDSAQEEMRADHVMASGALPPAFGAVRIDGDLFWDGGICSNTPMERVLNDDHHLPSLVFTTRIWQGHGEAPDNMWATLQRMKDIQFASRADTHLSYERQVNHLRCMLRALLKDRPKGRPLPESLAHLMEDATVSTYHVVKLHARPVPHEDHGKDIDFSALGIARRRRDGYGAAREALRTRPWEMDPAEGVYTHDFPSVR